MRLFSLLAKSQNRWATLWVGCWFAVILSSCTPLAETEANEQKNPHFITGKTFASNMDWDRAIGAFEDALTTNPKNASAHWELGLLYEKRKNDFAAAIYHYKQHLKLRPTSNVASIAEQHINSCTIDLAKSVASVLNPQASAQFVSLNAQIDQLRQENTQLRSQLSAIAARPTPAANPPPRSFTNVTRPREGGEPTPPTPGPTPTPTEQFKDYVIKLGDNPSKIALANGLGKNWKLLMEANPGLSETKLRPGKTIRIPIK